MPWNTKMYGLMSASVKTKGIYFEQKLSQQFKMLLLIIAYIRAKFYQFLSICS